MDIDHEDEAVLVEIRDLRDSLAESLRTPRRWTTGMRRTTQARALQGSNTIEGYTVSDQDAVDAQTLRSLHFMLLEHDLSVDPGRIRPGPIDVRDESAGRTVYEGPPADTLDDLIDTLVTSLRHDGADTLVDAAMAHLKLVMIHPFKDGNGRMARALQTLVLAQDHVLEPTFSSIEEWLGSNTDDYYRVLAMTGEGRWSPDNDARLWVQFNLRAHHMQAQTLRRRFDEADRILRSLDDLILQHGLPGRTVDALFDAVLGLRVTRPAYVKQSQIEEQTASRDLRRLVESDPLEAVGNTRGRHYLASTPLRALGQEMRSTRASLVDPYPWLRDDLRRRARR